MTPTAKHAVIVGQETSARYANPPGGATSADATSFQLVPFHLSMSPALSEKYRKPGAEPPTAKHVVALGHEMAVSSLAEPPAEISDQCEPSHCSMNVPRKLNPTATHEVVDTQLMPASDSSVNWFGSVMGTTDHDLPFQRSTRGAQAVPELIKVPTAKHAVSERQVMPLSLLPSSEYVAGLSGVATIDHTLRSERSASASGARKRSLREKPT